MVGVKIFVFDGNGGQVNIVRELTQGDWGAVLIGVNLIKKLSMAIKNLGGDRGWVFGERGGVGDVFKEENKQSSEPKKGEAGDDEEVFFIKTRKWWELKLDLSAETHCF